VPGMREIKGTVLGRLPYYLVWQLPIALPSFLPLLIALAVVSSYYCLAVISPSLTLFS